MDGLGAEGRLGFIVLIGILLGALLTGGGSAIYFCSARGLRFAETLMQLGALACIVSILAAGLGFFLLSTVREITDALSSPSPCPLPRGARGHWTVISRTVLTGDPEYAWALIWLILLCLVVGVLRYAYRKWKDE